MTVNNWFYLYESVSSEILEESVNDSDDTILTEENEPNENDDVDNKSIGEEDMDWVKWVVWGIIIVVILSIIMFMIWFFILRKNDGSIVPSSSPNSSAPVVPKTGPRNVPVNRIASQG